MSQALVRPMRNLGTMRQQYEALETSIERPTAKQAALAANIACGQALGESRSALKAGIFETVGTAMAMGAPVVGSTRQAASFRADL